MKLLGIISDFFLQKDFTRKKAYKMSYIVNEAIRDNFQTHYFFYEQILYTKKHKKQTSE